MKRKAICFLAFMAMCIASAYAQIDDEMIIVKPKKNVFQLGLKVGGNLSSISNPDECDLFESSGVGFSGSIAMGMRFGCASENSKPGTGLLGIGLDLGYRNSISKTYAVDEKGKENANLSLSYLDIPVAIQLYPCYKISSVNTLRIEAGVSFSTLLNSKPESLTMNNLSGEYSSVTYNVGKDGSKLKGGDMRPFAGIGYTIPKAGLGLNVRYYIGTSKLAENFSSKVSSLDFSISWMFNAAKF